MAKKIKESAIKSVEMLIPGMYISFLKHGVEIVGIIDSISNRVAYVNSNEVPFSMIISIGSIHGSHRVDNYKGNFYEISRM